MGYRLGLPLLTAGPCRSETCDREEDANGDHALHCHDDHGVRGGRHDRIRDKIFLEAQHASLDPLKEVPSLVPGSQSRPADVFIRNWLDGRRVAFDISVVSPVQDAVVLRAADISGAAIEMRKASKNRIHFDNCRAQGIHFQPLIVETFGGWDKDALVFLKAMAHQDARRWGKNNAMECKQFFQRLSVALQRGNAALLVNRDDDRA